MRAPDPLRPGGSRRSAGESTEECAEGIVPWTRPASACLPGRALRIHMKEVEKQMIRTLTRGAVFAAGLLALSAPAAADHRYGPSTFKYGPDCKRLQRLTGQDRLVVGTVLGGQNRRGLWGDGTFRDYRTFQACFVSVEACEAWTARQAAHHPMPPGYARCTSVYVGLTRPRPTLHREVTVIRARY